MAVAVVNQGSTYEGAVRGNTLKRVLFRRRFPALWVSNELLSLYAFD